MSDLTQPLTPGDHILGPADAPITLMQYGDFQCPSCVVAVRVVDKLLREFHGRLRFAFRHFPYEPRHPLAFALAEAAEFAATEDKFWPMHHTLFAHQEELSTLDKLPDLARALELDPAALLQALADHRFLPRVEAQGQTGKDSGVNTTPVFFLNGARYTGENNYDALAAAIGSAGH